MKINVPKNHPRYHSIMNREKIIHDCKKHIVAPAGLLAHGRGEAFDYLLGEQTNEFALKAIKASAAEFLLAKNPVISVNGNIASLCPEDLVELAKITGAKLEINLFYRSKKREKAIYKALKNAGAKKIYGCGKNANATIPELGSERRRVDPEGILIADLVLVPLEDGDRTEALKRTGKKIITVDLNPLSRTAQKSDITIIDNVIRCIKELNILCLKMKDYEKTDLNLIIKEYDNKSILKESLGFIKNRLDKLQQGN